jgi:arylsulfatase A-like enzyme
MNLKKKLLLGVVATIAITALTSSFLLKPFEDDKFKIYFDEKLIQGKAEYLADSVANLSQHKRPNIIVILADDLGATDISLYGNKLVSTPNIDGIGRNGVTFTEGYISSPVCSPSRAGLLTGRYQQRFGHEFQPNTRYLRNMFQYYAIKLLPRFKPLSLLKSRDVPSVEERLRQGLPPSEITMAEMLKKYHYTTGIFGKWHLGAADFAIPCNRGFDYQYGFYEAFTMYAPKTDTGIANMPLKRDYMDEHEWNVAEGRKGNCALLTNCQQCVETKKYLTTKLTDEAIAFMDQHHAPDPFFLYLPYNAPHAPLQVEKQYYKQFAHIKDPVKRIYAAMIKCLDDQVGRVLRHVDSLGIADNTIIVFLSDNGGAVYNGTTDNAPYRGGKLTNFEGGLKVPFMMQWAGHIKPGSVYTHPIISLDIFATVAAAIGIDLPTDRVYDGVDLVPYANGKKAEAHKALYWRSDFNKAIRKDEWKLIINDFDKTTELYNIKEDSTEQINLADKKPQVVKSLLKEIDEWESGLVKPLWPRVVNYEYEDEKGMHTFAF